jgi:radical SAM protein with 4Fe4S-binding SPASM domain
MKFNKAYIEITNICGLSCSFCPSISSPPKTIPLNLFEKILIELRPYADEVSLHVVGDPLCVKDLSSYLDLCLKFGFKVHITTSGYYIAKVSTDTLLHSAIKQINFSLNSFNKNDLSISFEEYMDQIFSFIEKKIEVKSKIFVNLRLWNLDIGKSEKEYNRQVIEYVEDFFNIKIKYDTGNKSIRAAPKVLIHFDDYFEWPSLGSTHNSSGYCHGLTRQLAILSNGKVVPCCLDHQGIMDLGNIFETPLKKILGSKRALKIKEGFTEKKAVEPLCLRCSYKDRFIG